MTFVIYYVQIGHIYVLSVDVYGIPSLLLCALYTVIGGSIAAMRR